MNFEPTNLKWLAGTTLAFSLTVGCGQDRNIGEVPSQAGGPAPNTAPATGGVVSTTTGGSISVSTGGTPNGGTANIGTGDAAAGGTSSPDAGECGDSAVLALLDQCVAATDQSSCQAAGGTWQQTSYYSYCACPTGQGSCSCTRNSQCRGSCIADVTDCDTATSGHCLPMLPTFGCFCWLPDQPGEGKGVCMD